jgi:hypothetical protein
MKLRLLGALALLALPSAAAIAQSDKANSMGEILVTANRLNAGYAQEGRPVIGLRRPADSAVVTVSFSSDSRDEATRKKEIQTMLATALDRAPAVGVELVVGTFELRPLTKANYQEQPFLYAGRIDTSKVDIMVKTTISGSAQAAQDRVTAFVKALPRNGRGAIDNYGGLTLTIVNPDQYRDAIVTLVAEDARHNAAIFGPDYAATISGIDGQIFWSQVSPTEVFLYLPYRYTIAPK